MSKEKRVAFLRGLIIGILIGIILFFWAFIFFGCSKPIYQNGYGYGTINMPDSTFFIVKHYTNGVDEYSIYKITKGDLNIRREHEVITILKKGVIYYKHNNTEITEIQHYHSIKN